MLTSKIRVALTTSASLRDLCRGWARQTSPGAVWVWMAAIT